MLVRSACAAAQRHIPASRCTQMYCRRREFESRHSPQRSAGPFVGSPATQRSEPLLPALGAAVQPNGKNHASHQDDHTDADCGKAGSPEGRPDASEEMPMSSPSSVKRRKYCHQRQDEHVQPLSSLHKTYRLES